MPRVIDLDHDAWVFGDEAVVGFEFDSQTAEDYAKGLAPGVSSIR